MLRNDKNMSQPGLTRIVNRSQGGVTDDPDGAQIPEVVQDDPEGVRPLLVELMDDIIGRLLMLQVLQLRPSLGKAFRNVIHRPAFLRNRPSSEGEFGPTYFTTDARRDLHWHGFDKKLRKWTRLPSLNLAPDVLPSPDRKFHNGYQMATDGGLLCITVTKVIDREELIICNPLTQTAKVLPPLIYARHPVLMHLKVNHDSGHYQVIVAGSVFTGTSKLCLKTEVYDSKTGAWECPHDSDLPCPPFDLNEYQTGVQVKIDTRELLMCVAFVDTRRKGVLVYDTLKKKWAQGPLIPLVDFNVVSHITNTQIVECGGSVFVFSEQKCGALVVYFVIHKLIPIPEASGYFIWDEVMKLEKIGGWELLIYPEFTCVPISEHQLCISHTMTHLLTIIELACPMAITPLQYSSSAKGKCFYSLNPINFIYKPSFKSVVSPEGRTQCQT